MSLLLIGFIFAVWILFRVIGIRFIFWHSTCLQKLGSFKRGFFSAVILWLCLGICIFGLGINRLSLVPRLHKMVLLIVFLFCFLLLNPPTVESKGQNSIYCPNNYAYQLESGDYLACEDFNEYFAARYQGDVLHHLTFKKAR